MELKKNIVLTGIEPDAPQKAILGYIKNGDGYKFEFKGINFAPKPRILGIYINDKLYKYNLEGKNLNFELKPDNFFDNISVVVLDKQNMLRPFLWGSQMITDNDFVMSKVIEEVNIASREEPPKTFKQSFEEFVKEEEPSKMPPEKEFSLKNTLDEEHLLDEQTEQVIDNYQGDIDNTDNDYPEFYLMVKDQVEKILSENPTEKILQDIIPDSRFVYVPRGNGDSYIFGIIYENDLPRYICYGERGKFSDERPEHLKEFYQWLPIDANNVGGDGYFMMYQDAFTGKNLEMTVI